MSVIVGTEGILEGSWGIFSKPKETLSSKAKSLQYLSLGNRVWGDHITSKYDTVSQGTVLQSIRARILNLGRNAETAIAELLNPQP